MMTLSDTIDVQDLPPYLSAPSGQGAENVVPFPQPGGSSLEEHERSLVVRALEAANGNQSKAARILRIGRDALRYKLKKYNLDDPDSGEAAAVAG